MLDAPLEAEPALYQAGLRPATGLSPGAVPASSSGERGTRREGRRVGACVSRAGPGGTTPHPTLSPEGRGLPNWSGRTSDDPSAGGPRLGGVGIAPVFAGVLWPCLPTPGPGRLPGATRDRN